MKINEIEDIENPINPIGVRQSPWDIEDNEAPSAPINKNYLGTGLYGAAYNLKDQQSIVKVGYNNLNPAEKDPYMFFIDYAVKNQGNPFLPRIHKIKKFAAGPKPGSIAASGDRLAYLERHFYYIHMEKLVPYTALTFGQLQACMNTYFSNDRFTETTLGGLMTFFNLSHTLISTVSDNLIHDDKLLSNEKYRLSPMQVSDYTDLIYDIQTRIPAILKAAVRNEYAKHFKDMPIMIKSKLLKRTMDEIKGLLDMNRTKIRDDIHFGNVMYRPTPYGVQPVITDPFAGQFGA